jgi:hypothetical protein
MRRTRRWKRRLITASLVALAAAGLALLSFAATALLIGGAE